MIRGWSAHLDMLYGGLALHLRPAAAARDGFHCVEMWMRPQDSEEQAFLQAIRDHELAVASVNTSAGWADSQFGVIGVPEATEWWQEDFLETLRFARKANACAINLLPGGREAHVTRRAQLDALVSNIDWALTQLADGDPTLLLEPLNSIDRRSPLIHNVDDAVAVLSRVSNPARLKILFDVYHLQQEERDLVSALYRCSSDIGHVQLADFPGRGAPGTGSIDFNVFMAELARVAYDGWIGLEYLPVSDQGCDLQSMRNAFTDLEIQLPQLSAPRPPQFQEI